MKQSFTKKNFIKKSVILLVVFSFYSTIDTKLIPLSSVIDYVQSLFKASVIAKFEGLLLEKARFLENGEILVDDQYAQKLIDTYLKNSANLLSKSVYAKASVYANATPDKTPDRPGDRMTSVVQFQVNRQRANSCGYHTIYNLKAIQDLLENGEILNEKNVKLISKMYFDGFLQETGQQESDIEEMAFDEDIMKFGSFSGLKNYFLIHYFSPYSELVKKNIVSAGFSVIQKNNNVQYVLGQENKALFDVKNSLKNNKFTFFVLRMGAHFVALSAIKENNNRYKIIYMNSTNSSLYNSEETLNFVEWLKNLIL